MIKRLIYWLIGLLKKKDQDKPLPVFTDYGGDEFDDDWEVRCPSCGKIADHYDEKCPHCDAQLLPLPPNGFGPDGRPHWGPRQVRTPRGIKPGEVLIMVSGRDQHRATIIVLSEPAPDRGDSPRFNYLYQGLKRPLSKRPFGTYLSDCGVVPYTSGMGWNRTNHLLRTGRRVDISKLDLDD